jgi:hypothetical protein
MAETRRKFDQDFKEGAVRLVRETGKPIAQVAKGPGGQIKVSTFRGEPRMDETEGLPSTHVGVRYPSRSRE